MRPRKNFPIRPRKVLTPRPTTADHIEALAANLRKVAAAWCASGEAPAMIINGHVVTPVPLPAPERTVSGNECSTNVLSYTDLIEDARLFEADAKKLRTLY